MGKKQEALALYESIVSEKSDFEGNYNKRLAAKAIEQLKAVPK
jgi:hypothetical protein